MPQDSKRFDFGPRHMLIAVSAAALIAAAAYLAVFDPNPPPPPVFTFDDGSVKGWTAEGIFDDTGKA